MTALGIDETLQTLLSCVCAKLTELGVPACSCFATVGNPTESIGLCCSCPSGTGELRASLTRVYRGDRTNGADSSVAAKPCAPVNWVAQYSVVLSRCFPKLSTSGNLPTGEKTQEAAAGLHADVAAMMRAIHCCVLDEPAYVEQVAIEQDPQGGCSYITLSVRAPITIKGASNLHP